MFNRYGCTHLNKASADPTYTIQQIRTFSAFFQSALIFRIGNFIIFWKIGNIAIHIVKNSFSDISFNRHFLHNRCCSLPTTILPHFQMQDTARRNRKPNSLFRNLCSIIFFTVTHSGSSKVFLRVFPP